MKEYNAFKEFTLSKATPIETSDKRHMPNGVSRLLAAASFFALYGLSPAQAMDTIEFFDALQKKVEENGSKLTFESLTKTGDDGARATNVELFNPEKNQSLKIGTLEVAGGTGETLETFSFGTLEANQLELTVPAEKAETVLTVEKLSAADFRTSGEANMALWPFEMGQGKAETIRMVSKGEANIAWNMPSIEITGLKRLGEKAFSLGALSISASSGSIASTDSDSGINGDFSQGPINISNWETYPGNGFLIGNAEIGNLQFEGVNAAEKKVGFSHNGATISNFYSPDIVSNEKLIWPQEEAIASLGPMEFVLDGERLMTFGGASSNSRFDTSANEYVSDFSMNDIFIDLKKIPLEGDQSAQLKPFFDLGYQTINLGFTGQVSWNPDSGDLKLSQMRYSADDVGAMDIAFKVNGYTTEVARKIQTIVAKMSEATDETLKQAMGFQLLAEASSLTIGEMTYTIDDKSITRRIMERQAAMSGQKPQDLIAAMPFMAGAALSQFQVPEFAASASAAIGTFMNSALNNSASITLSAKPDSPVSVAEIMGIVAGAQAGTVPPSEIIEKFNITVSAK